MFANWAYWRLLLWLPTVLISASADNWDLAVTVGKSIDFLSKNGSLVSRIEIPQVQSLSALAYDDETNTAYFSDTFNHTSSIYSIELNQSDSSPSRIIKRENENRITTMAYFAESKTLFWTEHLHQSIMKMQLDGLANQVELHHLPQHISRGLAIDLCNRHLYWTTNVQYNEKMQNVTIDRSDLDGSNRITVVNGNLYEPVGITVDNEDQKLYWVDDLEGIFFKIERCNFDGSNRETVFTGKNHQPLYIVIDHENIYWTDRSSNSVWFLSKSSRNSKPQVLKSYSSEEVHPVNMIMRQRVECRSLNVLNVGKKSEFDRTDHLIYDITTSSLKIPKEKSEYCSNKGYLDSIDNTCHCDKGYTGERCETSLCHNYCFEGKCKVDVEGDPKCICSESHEGDRCERKKCDNYCFDNGECYIANGKPKCRCKYFNTTRCEMTEGALVEFCAALCTTQNAHDANSTYKALCRCPNEQERVLKKSISYPDLLGYNVVVPFLGVLVTILSMVVGVLSFYVNKLKRRPRIKRRYVVNRTGVTPLTSRPQVSGEQCEITIENCCNMNICETPCFEPKLRNTMPTSLKKEEKNSLLDNMENNIF